MEKTTKRRRLQRRRNSIRSDDSTLMASSSSRAPDTERYYDRASPHGNTAGSMSRDAVPTPIHRKRLRKPRRSFESSSHTSDSSSNADSQMSGTEMSFGGSQCVYNTSIAVKDPFYDGLSETSVSKARSLSRSDPQRKLIRRVTPPPPSPVRAGTRILTEKPPRLRRMWSKLPYCMEKWMANQERKLGKGTTGYHRVSIGPTLHIYASDPAPQTANERYAAIDRIVIQPNPIAHRGTNRLQRKKDKKPIHWHW